jgi:hypothetical protein
MIASASRLPAASPTLAVMAGADHGFSERFMQPVLEFLLRQCATAMLGEPAGD